MYVRLSVESEVVRRAEEGRKERDALMIDDC